MRSLALDVGDRKIGVALSDPMGILASPLTIIPCHEEDSGIEAIADIIGQYTVKQVIVGLPRLMDGSLGRQAEKVKAFAGKLAGYIDVPIDFRDERLTTLSAKRLVREANTKRSKRSPQDDAIAAALILQSYLDEER